MKRIICKILGHKWWYVFPATPICSRCKYIPTHRMFGNEKEWDKAVKAMNDNFRKSHKTS